MYHVSYFLLTQALVALKTYYVANNIAIDRNFEFISSASSF